MKLSLLEAANKIGMSKVGLYKAIKKGTISAEKDTNGQWQIDPAELFRVYKPVSPVSAEKLVEVSDSKPKDNSSLQPQVDLMREQINDLREQLSQAHADKAKIMKMMDEQISTMRLLSDQREQKPEQGRGLWQRLFG